MILFDFEKVVQIFKLKRTGGAPKDHKFAFLNRHNLV